MHRKLAFRGSSTCLFGDILITMLLSLVTLGIYGPWGYVRIRKKMLQNTYLDDQPLDFDGTGGELFKIAIRAFFLTLITLGIHALLCYPLVNVLKWDTEHQVLPGGKRASYEGTALDLFGQMIVVGLLSMVTMGIYSFWGYVRIRKHVCNQTLLDEIPWQFEGTAGGYFKVAIVTWLLTTITFGIYGLVGAATIKLYRWEAENTLVPLAAMPSAPQAPLTPMNSGDDGRPIQVNVTVNR